MAEIHARGKTVHLEDGAPVMDACETLGVPFGCRGGQCATCLFIVVSGAENLAPPGVLEEWMELAPGERLACQARIRSGRVEILW
jgi:ferredoxin